ncbi:MAG: hypothetical protein LBU09_01585 [Endomicrobium sp.]|jgi:hypothetical protein|nr:hypothetical protein [Endomicrobium sp.]
MFYAKKYLFFIILYAFSFILYNFINRQIMISQNFTASFIYPLVIFGAIAVISFFAALAISMLYKYSSHLLHKMFKVKKHEIAFQIFWALFSVFCYLIAAAAFFKTTQY